MLTESSMDYEWGSWMVILKDQDLETETDSWKEVDWETRKVNK